MTRALANAHWPALRDLLAQSERSVEELPRESEMSADFEKGVDQGSRAALYLINEAAQRWRRWRVEHHDSV